MQERRRNPGANPDITPRAVAKFILRLCRDLDRVADKQLQAQAEFRELMKLQIMCIQALATEEVRQKMEWSLAELDSLTDKELDRRRLKVISRLARKVASKKQEAA